MQRLIPAVSTMVLTTSLLLAQEPPVKPGPQPPQLSPQDLFRKLDQDSNGSLSFDEFKAGPTGQKSPSDARTVFKLLDLNADGLLSLAEFAKRRQLPEPETEPAPSPAPNIAAVPAPNIAAVPAPAPAAVPVPKPALVPATNPTPVPVPGTASNTTLNTTIGPAPSTAPSPGAVPATPEKPSMTRAEIFFKKLDTDKDGALTLEEFKADPSGHKNPVITEQYFKRLDKDADGKLTLEEVTPRRP